MLTQEFIKNLSKHPGVQKHMLLLHLNPSLMPETKGQALDKLYRDAMFYNMSRETFKAAKLGIEEFYKSLSSIAELSALEPESALLPGKGE